MAELPTVEGSQGYHQQRQWPRAAARGPPSRRGAWLGGGLRRPHPGHSVGRSSHLLTNRTMADAKAPRTDHREHNRRYIQAHRNEIEPREFEI